MHGKQGILPILLRRTQAPDTLDIVYAGPVSIGGHMTISRDDETDWIIGTISRYFRHSAGTFRILCPRSSQCFDQPPVPWQLVAVWPLERSTV